LVDGDLSVEELDRDEEATSLFAEADLPCSWESEEFNSADLDWAPAGRRFRLRPRPPRLLRRRAAGEVVEEGVFDADADADAS
jgi:hypothetical protein